VTSAGLPLVSVAANWWTRPPVALVALQPAQLVSMELAPGVTEKPTFEEFPVPTTPPHPAAKSSAGARSIGRFLKGRGMGKSL
jgi:hypothetical protein